VVVYPHRGPGTAKGMPSSLAQPQRITGPEGRERPLTVAVTGASGTVGPALLARLAEAETVSAVRVLGRRRTADMPDSVAFREVDVRDAAAVEQAVAGADVVVHMAFALYGVRPGEDDLFATNVRGTGNVARAAAQTGAERFIYTSSAAVYGLRADNPQPLTEENEIRASARHFYSRHKAQCELVVREQLSGSATAAYIFRPCGIVGPHAAGATMGGLPEWAPRRIAGALRGLAAVGLRPWLPAPPVALQFVHEDDVAQALVRAVAGAGEPGVYNLAGDGVVNGSEALALLGVRPLPLPRGVVDRVFRTVAAAPQVVPAVSWPALVTEPILIDPGKALRTLGWRPRWDTRAAPRATRAGLGW
jgi:nucleoside-diphosphate-sugar epimerase